MRKLITILLIIAACSLQAQNMTLVKGITKDSTRTLVNNAIKVKSESLYRGNSTSMSYLSANWSAGNLKNYLNVLYDSVEANFPAASLTDIRFGMTGKTLISTYNANLANMAAVMGYQTYPVGAYKIWGQKNNIKVGYLSTGGDSLRVSLDGGSTWTKSVYLALADSVTVCEIFANGTIIIATEQPHLYRSTDTLTTLTEINLQAEAGGNYTYHTPVDWHYPGDYFQTLTSPEMGWVKVGGVNKEILMFGNYLSSGSRNGPAPVNVYYSINGESVKVAYTWGVNRYDNGTGGGSATTGNPLGNPSAMWRISHTHDITWNPNDSTFWMCTGDTPSTGIWTFNLKYHPSGDSVEVSVIMRYQTGGLTYDNAPQFKIVGMSIEGDTITWAADVDPVTDANRRFTGIWRSHINDYTDTTKHRHLWTSNQSLVGMEKVGDIIVAAGYSPKSLFVSMDDGLTFEDIELNTNDFGLLSYFKKIIQPDSNGYFLIQGQYNNYNPSTASKSVLFKPLAQ